MVTTKKHKMKVGRQFIVKQIKENQHIDKFNILKSKEHIKYWTAITYYDNRLASTIIGSVKEWYNLICSEIKEEQNVKKITQKSIYNYYQENC